MDIVHHEQDGDEHYLINNMNNSFQFHENYLDFHQFDVFLSYEFLMFLDIYNANYLSKKTISNNWIFKKTIIYILDILMF